MLNKENWEETKAHFERWWNREGIGRPLFHAEARKAGAPAAAEPVPASEEDVHIGVAYTDARVRERARRHVYLAESYPYADLNIGPGSLAVYLGAEPVFRYDTVWFRECVEDFRAHGEIRYLPDNVWFRRHLESARALRALAGQDYVATIPDLVEGPDILSAMRGGESFCFDLIDEPELIRQRLDELNRVYPAYYDAFRDATAYEPDLSQYTGFRILGRGRIAKIQCDVSALMNMRQFEEFVMPTLRAQARWLDRTLYHLDGVDCIKFADLILGIPELDALQWTPGAGKADGLDESWFPIYDKVHRAGKGIWASTELPENRVRDALEVFYRRYGSAGVYIHLPAYGEEFMRELIRYAEQNWR